jgi:hypothetical protein
MEQQPALSSLQQQTVWEEWLASEIRALYFADLGSRYVRMQRLVTWLTLLCSSGAFLSLVTEVLPPRVAWIRPVLAFAAATLSFWLVAAQNQRRVTDCSDLHFRWQRLGNAYRSLWDHMYAPDAEAELRMLTEHGAELSRSSAAFPNDKKRMRRWQEYVEQQHAATAAA